MPNWRTVTSVKDLAAERGWAYRTHAPARTERYQLSKTSLESFHDFLAHAEEWIRVQDTQTMQRSTPRAARAFGRLYAYTSYPIAECFSCEIPEAILIGEEGVICTPDGAVLVESHVHKGTLGTRVAVTRAQAELASMPRWPGTFVSLRAFFANNYCHWLLDCLTRLALLDRLELGPETRFVLPAILKQFHLDSLALLGIGEEQLVYFEGSCVQLERLVMCRTSPELSTPHPLALFALIDRLKRAVLDGEPPPSRRIYVSRVNAARMVVNEEDLAPVLRDFGFEIVRCERLTFAEQIRLFAEAGVILGPHGAGLMNHIFSPPGARVIELFHPLFFSDNVQRITAMCRQEHWHLYGEPVEDGGILNMRVDAAKLRALLELACPL